MSVRQRHKHVVQISRFCHQLVLLVDVYVSFNALTLLVGLHEGHLTCRNAGTEVFVRIVILSNL